MSRFFHSLRWRLQAWHGLILLLTVIALCGTVYQLATGDRNRRIDQELERSERQLMRSLLAALPSDGANRPPPSPASLRAALAARPFVLPESIRELFSSTEPGYHYFISKDETGAILLSSPNAPANRELLPPITDTFNETHRTLDSFRESLRTGPEGLASLVGRDISTEQELLTRFTWSLIACGLATWLGGLIGGWWLAGRAIKPIATISATAARIADGNLSERIDTAGTDNELDELSQVLNETFDRLNAAFERQRRFTADAAHELRTPVTILLNESQRILKRERSGEEYRQSFVTCQETAQRMRRLTETLLLLARQEAAADRGTHAPGDLAQIAADTIKQLGPLAITQHVETHAALAPAPARLDADAIAILVSNLVANALHHHRPEGGNVWVNTTTLNGEAVLTVRDDGPGIPPDDLGSIFERFHRADQARTGGSQRTGLGLAIAKAIADNHRGTIEVASEMGRGTTFTVRLPAAD